MCKVRVRATRVLHVPLQPFHGRVCLRRWVSLQLHIFMARASTLPGTCQLHIGQPFCSPGPLAEGHCSLCTLVRD